MVINFVKCFELFVYVHGGKEPVYPLCNYSQYLGSPRRLSLFLSRSEQVKYEDWPIHALFL